MQPSDDVVLTLLGTSVDFRSRLGEALVRRRLPALVLEDVPRGAFRPVLLRMLGDDDGQPLRWATHGVGLHGLEPVDLTDLIVDLAVELDCVIESSSGVYGGVTGDPGAGRLSAAITAFGDAFTADLFTWYSPGDTDVVSVLARRSGEAWRVCSSGAGYVAEPTASAHRVFESFYWGSPKGGMFLARSGSRRGAGFCGEAGLQVHWWDEDWIAVDPSRPWEMDGEGEHVRNYLDFLLPDPEPALWTENFGLDDEHAEELRILFRSPRSDEATFDRLVTATGVPPLLADVASGRVRLRDIEGSETIEPSTFWQAMKNLAREEIERPVSSPAWARPFARWEAARRDRSRFYLGYMGVTIVVLSAAIGFDLVSRPDSGAWWWKGVGLALVVVDVCRPRRGATGADPADDGIPSPKKPTPQAE